MHTGLITNQAEQETDLRTQTPWVPPKKSTLTFLEGGLALLIYGKLIWEVAP